MDKEGQGKRKANKPNKGGGGDQQVAAHSLIGNMNTTTNLFS
jgi:hypothetical protein